MLLGGKGGRYVLDSDKKIDDRDQTVIQYLKSKRMDIFKIIDKYIEQLGNPEKIDKASIRQIATAFNLVVDKFIQVESMDKNSSDKIDRLIEAIKNAE